MIREFELLPEFEELHNTDFYKANKDKLPDYKDLAYCFTTDKLVTITNELFKIYNLSEEQIKAFLLRGIEEPESYKEFINSLALDFQKNTLANKDFIANLQRTSDADYKDQIVKAELNDNSKPIDEKIKLADHHFNINSEICKIIDDCTPDRDLARSKVFSFQSERQKYLIKWFTYLNSFKIQKEFETNNFPFIQNYKKERLAIDALEAAAEDIILDNEKQAEINFENPQGPLEEISEEIIAGQIKFDDNFDQTKYKDWTTFIRTTGNQTSVTPNSPEYHWYKWFLPNKNLSEFTFITQSVGTVLPELRDKLGFWIQSLNEGKGGFMTVAEIGDNAALLQEAESNVRVIVFKKNGELVVDPSNNPISTSLSLPEYKYTNPDSPRLGEIRFATSHLEEALIEEGLTPEEAEEVIENTLKRGAEEYGKWLEGVKKNKTQLNINGLNPGARNGNLKMQPVGIVGGVLTEVEYKELEKNSDLLNIFIETYIGEGNAKVVDTVINGTTFKVYAGLPYVIVNGVPTALRKTTLTEKDITRTVELLKFAAKNPDKFKMIEDHIKTYINTFSREGKPSNYRFYLFQTKSGFTVNYGTNKFITSEQLLSGDVQGLKDFLATKEYNIDKKTLNAENSTYTKLDIKNGSLVFDTYTHYKMWIADPNESKFAIRSYPIPMDQSGELDFDRYLNEAPRLNPTLQFIDNKELTFVPVIKEEVIPSVVPSIIPSIVVPEVIEGMAPDVMDALGILPEVKQPKPPLTIYDFVGKEITLKNRTGILGISQGGIVTIETPLTIYEIGNIEDLQIELEIEETEDPIVSDVEYGFWIY